MNAADELNETRTLVRFLHQALENFRKTITPRTGDAPAAKKAADRAEEALIECMRKATDELAGSDLSFECKSCGGRHDLTRDRRALLSGNFRWIVPHGTRQERERPVEDYVVLVRAFRYHHEHAKEVVRQLKLRGWKTDVGEGKAAGTPTAANGHLVPV